MGHHRDQRTQGVGNGHVLSDPGGQRALQGLGHKREVASDALDHAEGQGVDVGPTIQSQALGLFG